MEQRKRSVGLHLLSMIGDQKKKTSRNVNQSAMRAMSSDHLRANKVW